MNKNIPPNIIIINNRTFKRIIPRGMSDYINGAGLSGTANYLSEDGILLKLRTSYNKPPEWQAQYKNFTTKRKPSAQEAIDSLDKLLNYSL
jgi:hypothetical protein